MVVTGDWVTPRLNWLKYFEKPALQYWATASLYTVFGVDELVAGRNQPRRCARSTPSGPHG